MQNLTGLCGRTVNPFGISEVTLKFCMGITYKIFLLYFPIYFKTKSICRRVLVKKKVGHLFMNYINITNLCFTPKSVACVGTLTSSRKVL
jgi:hypothetical protein